MYERTFGTDWDTVEDRDEAVWRAFGLGVAECLGESHPGELERITDATDSTYDRSFIELAYQKGRQRVQGIDATVDDQRIWAELVENQTELDLWGDPETTFESETDTETGDSGLPESLQGVRIDTMPSDSTERVQRPTFLDRDSPKRRGRNADGDRSPFGGRSSNGRDANDGDESDGGTAADEDAGGDSSADE